MIDQLLKKDIIPDWAIRLGIRSLLTKRIQQEDPGSDDALEEKTAHFVKMMKASPVAVNTREANEQHYEVPHEFYERVLGDHLKYSSGWWDSSAQTLSDAEKAMLDITLERAGIQDGQEVLELGCGWGSLSLYAASRFPKVKWTAVSNSKTQKEYIESKFYCHGIKGNLEIITADMNAFDTDKRFDRVVSVEMFEHMRNVGRLLSRIDGWLKEDGKLFLHIFTHKRFSYLFEPRSETDWMSRYFFTGGMMPAEDLYSKLGSPLAEEKRWRVNGRHYQRTAEAWLANMDLHKAEIMDLFRQCYPAGEAQTWFSYWRIFFMSCAELWGYKNGEEWGVTHYLFGKKHD